MKNNRIAVILILFIVMMASCAENVNFEDLNIKYIDRLVVDGMITTEKKEHKVLLYHSSKLNFSDSLLKETGANVSITDGDTIMILAEKSKGEYLTGTAFAGKINKTYTLNIKLKDGQEYLASSYLYPSMIVDSMYSILDGQEWGIFVKAHSGHGNGAACIVDLYVNDTLLTAYIEDKGVYAWGAFNEKLFSLSESKLKKDTSRVQIQMYSISYQYFNYIIDIKNETVWSTEIFRTNQANVRTNISNGGLGFFVASDVLRKQLLIVRE